MAFKKHEDQGNRTKEFQDFFTPDKIAKELFEQYKGYLKPKPYINKVLEPTVGTGNLLWPLLESEFNIQATCIDIQFDYIKALAKTAKEKGYSLSKDKYGLVISNF